MGDTDWLYFNRNQILIALSMFLAGIFGWLLWGGEGCFYAILCVLCFELIWWSLNG